MALVDNAWYVNYGNGSSTGYWALTAWAATTTKVCGAIVRPLTAQSAGNERAYVAVASTSGTGQTGGSEPAWTFTRGVKITDGGVTWQEATGIAALNGDLTNTPTWNTVKNTSVTLGQVIQNVAGTLVLICTTAGTAGNGAEPSWAAFTNAGATTADNTATWTTLGASFSAWAAPHARLANAFASTWGQAANTFFVGDNHAETQASAINLTSPGASNTRCNIYCVDHTASVPPGSANLKATATITNTTNVKLLATGYAYCYGVTFTTSNTTGASQFTNWILDSCGIVASASGPTAIGDTAVDRSSLTVMNNTTFSSTGGGSLFAGIGKMVWKNTPSALGTVPTTLFATAVSGNSGTALIEGVDLSAAGSGKTLVGSGIGSEYFLFLNCKLGASVTIAAPGQEGGCYVDVINSDSSGTNYQQQRYWYTGTLTPETVVVRSGGASDGTTSISWKHVTGSGSSWVDPFESFPIAVWNALTGANRTVTVYGVVNAAAVPNNDQLWMEIEYLGSSGSPLGSFANNTKANNLASGTALTADSTSSWGASGARANTTAYSVGNTISLASNPGRVFFCTTGGTTAGSEPGGYASAVDGGSVTDGTAVFRAGCRFKLVVTLSSPQPQLVGYLYATIKAAQPSSAFYVDPLLNLS